MKVTASLVMMVLIYGLPPSFAAGGATKPIYVLVHGANFSADCWNWVRSDLADGGFQSVAPQLYRPDEKVDLETVALRLCSNLSAIGSPVVLVGHSQGGAIVTQAAASCGSLVKAIIYVTAVVPAPGAGVFDQLSDADNAFYGQCGALDQQSNTYFLKGLEDCRPVFFGDAPLGLSKTYFKMMEDEPAGIGNSKAAYLADRLKSIPRYYVETENDLIISPATQQKIVAQLSLRGIFHLSSSHTPFFWSHKALSEVLKNYGGP